MRVAIGVCTACRSQMLARCLEALACQVAPQDCDVEIIVADNEPTPRNREAVAAFAGRCPFPVHYVHEPRRGISHARNAVLEACEDRFDWLAFTDDDCVPASDWVAALLAAAERHSARDGRGGAGPVLVRPERGAAQGGSGARGGRHPQCADGR
jgi:GT2 family glycosyltransferase